MERKRSMIESKKKKHDPKEKRRMIERKKEALSKGKKNHD